MIQGLDVSHHDGQIDWERVARAGAKFVFIKATEGLHYVDPLFKKNWDAAGKAGLFRGAYHFFRPGYDPLRQANLFLNVVASGETPPELPHVIDFEVSGGGSHNQEIDQAMNFLVTIGKAQNRNPIFYSYPGFIGDLHLPKSFGQYTLWIAHYRAHTPTIHPPWTDYKFWQYVEDGRIDGVHGDVDLNWFAGTVEDLKTI